MCMDGAWLARDFMARCFVQKIVALHASTSFSFKEPCCERLLFFLVMPTALDVEVDDAITPPPHVSKKKSSTTSKKSNSEASKITPVPSTTKKKQPQKAQQPSIMSFFNQNSVAEHKKKQESVAKPRHTERQDDSTTAAPCTYHKPSPAMPANNTTKVPTAQELRDIVLGTSASKNLDNVLVPEPTHGLPEGAEDELLPIVHMPSPPPPSRQIQTNKKAPPPPSPMRNNDAMNNNEENEVEKSLDAVPKENESNVDLSGEENQETKNEKCGKCATSRRNYQQGGIRGRRGFRKGK